MSAPAHTQHPTSADRPESGDEHHDTISESVSKAMHAEDEPMESSAPFALVALSYLVVLAIAALAIAGVAWYL
ncbi:hypothetical protein [Roseimaritima sediminicola]|uniref:hypothetical protein n=1 Tax=Roseimaritima sediminicola TaxID=2662066 RepID=UPI0012982FC6|nr:hypothetical protein [Roseimaritima sediminicola]